MCFMKKGQRTVGSWSKQALGLLPYVKQYELFKFLMLMYSCKYLFMLFLIISHKISVSM